MKGAFLYFCDLILFAGLSGILGRVHVILLVIQRHVHLALHVGPVLQGLHCQRHRGAALIVGQQLLEIVAGSHGLAVKLGDDVPLPQV